MTELFSRYGTLFVLPMAFILDLSFGEFPGRLHPVSWMGSFIRGFDHAGPRSSRKTEFLYGTLFILGGLFLFSLPLYPLRFLPLPLSIVLSGLLLKQAFSVRFLFRAAREVRAALLASDLREARRLVSYHLVSRDTSSLSQAEVSSCVIESLAENLTDSIVSPLFFFCLGGLPAAWAYRFANTADAMIGYHDPKHEYRGKFAARLDDVLNFIPARLTAVFIAFGALLAGERGRASLRCAFTVGRTTSSPNAGRTMGAMAGALGIILEKKGCYVLSGGAALPDDEAIGRAVRVAGLSAAVSFLFFSLFSGVLYAISS